VIENRSIHSDFSEHWRIKVFTSGGSRHTPGSDIAYDDHTWLSTCSRMIRPDGTVVKIERKSIFDRTLVKGNGRAGKPSPLPFPASRSARSLSIGIRRAGTTRWRRSRSTSRHPFRFKRHRSTSGPFPCVTFPSNSGSVLQCVQTSVRARRPLPACGPRLDSASTPEPFMPPDRVCIRGSCSTTCTARGRPREDMEGDRSGRAGHSRQALPRRRNDQEGCWGSQRECQDSEEVWRRSMTFREFASETSMTTRME